MPIKLTSAAVAACVFVTAATAADARQAPKPLPQLKPDQRICVVQPPITGSILPTRECKTVAEWRKDGIDPAQLIARKK